MKTITIFSLNINDNISTCQDNLHNLCFNSWERMRKFFSTLDLEMNIKIYTKEDIEFKEFYNEFTSRTNYTLHNLKISHVADAFRLYIMSNKQNYMWLDWDLFILNDFNIQDFNYSNKIFRKSFSILYNGVELDFFKKIYNYVLNNNLNRYRDVMIVEELINSKVIDNTDLYDSKFPSIRNLFWLKYNEKNWTFKNNSVHIIRDGKDKLVKDLGNDKSLMYFILNNYNLSKEQNKELDTWIKVVN